MRKTAKHIAAELRKSKSKKVVLPTPPKAAAKKDVLTELFNKPRKTGYEKPRAEEKRIVGKKTTTDILEITCLIAGIVGLTISWMPFIGFVAPAVSFIAAYRIKKKDSKFKLMGIVLSLISVIICISIMITLAVNPAVFGL